jgi:hypothetical protein
MPGPTGNLQFETTNHVRQMLTFGYALWTEPVLTNMILDIESKMVYTSLGPQIGHWDSAWNRCNDLGDGWRLFSQRDVKAGRVVTDIATGYSAYMTGLDTTCRVLIFNSHATAATGPLT